MRDTSRNARLVSMMTSCRALKYASSRSTLLVAISHRALLKWPNNLASSSKLSSFLGREPEADASVALLRWTGFLQEAPGHWSPGNRSDATQVIPSFTRAMTLSAASVFLGVVPALGRHCHLLSIFLHVAMGHLGHCFSKVKIVIPLRMAGG